MSQLFSLLHALYGNNRVIVANEFGGFDVKAPAESDLMKSGHQRSSPAQLAEVVDFL